ncbi:hypothetical protein EDB80DRAFT_731754 [Ilyonectria destructans]|nr:hypothetical protein EDB80DRAFT_731754 [Ilyonectria destructans]
MIHLLELTVGQVAAIIAAGVAVIKLCLPNLLVFLFIGILREDNSAVTASAVSWSAISKLLYSSNWPTLLCGDSAASEGVVLSARIFKYVGLLAILLVSIAAIVTPLGLYEAVVPSESLTDESFHYRV